MRHGATNWNLEARYQGTRETHLSAVGEAQVLNNARLIEETISNLGLNKKSFSIVSSPLARARESADIIRDAAHISSVVTIVPAFRELSLGRWEGLTSQQVKDQFYEERKSRKSNRWDFRPLGGESMAQRLDEVTKALENLQSNTIVVTHSVILRIIFHVLGMGNREECAIMETPHDQILLWDGKNPKRLP